MGDYWIVTSHKYVRHLTEARAINERKRLAKKVPDATFRVLRCKTSPTPSKNVQAMIAILLCLEQGALAADVLPATREVLANLRARKSADSADVAAFCSGFQGQRK